MDEGSRASWLARLSDLVKGKRTSNAETLEAEIQVLVDQGEAQGLLTPAEGDMIEAVLDLDETLTRQIMVPRTSLVAAPAGGEPHEIIGLIVESGHSRLPLYGKDLDDVVGVLYAKDLLPYWGKPMGELELEKIARQPYFVAQSMPVDRLLAEFRRRKIHMAVVVDEYGGTAGLVTMEDVLEEIVGEIEDEYDQEPILIREQGDGSLVVDARLEVDHLGEALDVEIPSSLPEGNFETVGGLITTLLGRVPKQGEQLRFNGLLFEVVEADARRITKAKVNVTAHQAREQTAGAQYP